jgi:hypothetical protein
MELKINQGDEKTYCLFALVHGAWARKNSKKLRENLLVLSSSSLW